MSRVDLSKFGIRNQPMADHQRERAGFRTSSSTESEEMINVAYIIKNKPSFKIVRKFFKENVKDLEDSD